VAPGARHANSPAGEFAVCSPYAWNLANLYTTGEVTLSGTGTGTAGDFNAVLSVQQPTRCALR